MPVRSTSSASGGNRAVIELSIPMRLVRGGGSGGGSDEAPDDDADSCYICANSFCATEQCSRTQTHLGCCTQAICCGCLLKSSKRCTCKEECDAVISLCPFCREVSSVEALDVFLGSKPACGVCLKADEVAAATPPTPAENASRVDDDDDDDE